MALIVVALLTCAAVYFVWRKSLSRPGRIAANVAGIVALLFMLLGTYGVFLYYRTATP